MKVYLYYCAPVGENTYFIDSENESHETLIIDPGCNGQDMIKQIDNLALNPIAILLTHGHYDHIGAVDEIRDAYNIPIYIHHLEKEFLTKPNLSYPIGDPGSNPVMARPADYLWDEMGEVELGPFNFITAHIPGHSPGSTAYLFERDGFAITGDTLFSGSVGRSDFLGGSHSQLIQGIQKYLLPLNNQTILYGGHGQPTRLEDEKKSNPFI